MFLSNCFLDRWPRIVNIDHDESEICGCFSHWAEQIRTGYPVNSRHSGGGSPQVQPQTGPSASNGIIFDRETSDLDCRKACLMRGCPPKELFGFPMRATGTESFGWVSTHIFSLILWVSKLVCMITAALVNCCSLTAGSRMNHQYHQPLLLPSYMLGPSTINWLMFTSRLLISLNHPNHWALVGCSPH